MCEQLAADEMPEKQLTIADKVPPETAVLEAKTISEKVVAETKKSDDSLKVCDARRADAHTRSIRAPRTVRAAQ